MKNLRSTEPYWLHRNGIISTYKNLTTNIKTDVLVIGARISRALVAEKLSSHGLETTVIDKRHCGLGSTAASTVMLQYEMDVPLYRLIKKIGK